MVSKNLKSIPASSELAAILNGSLLCKRSFSVLHFERKGISPAAYILWMADFMGSPSTFTARETVFSESKSKKHFIHNLNSKTRRTK